MIKIKLELQYISEIVCVCEKQPFGVDVEIGRYIIDGASMLGMLSVAGSDVTIVPATDDKQAVRKFYEALVPYGARWEPDDVLSSKGGI